MQLQKPTLVPPSRGFSHNEFSTRLERIQSAMHKRKLGALWLTTEADIQYCTGFLTQFWQSPTRPWYVVVPLVGKPIAVIPEIGVSCMRGEWISDIRSWSSPHAHDDGVSLITETLREVRVDAIAQCGNEFGAIGINKGRETHMRLPLNDFDQISEGLFGPSHTSNFPHASNFVDATAVMRDVRLVKSEAEIDKIRFVATCVSNVFARLLDFVHVGMRDDEIFRAFKVECLNAGVDDVAYLVGAAAADGYDDIISPPSGRVLAPGDVLILDTGAKYDGYFCDFDRNFGFGAVHESVHAAYRAVWRATEAGLDAARPGNTCADIFRAMDTVLQAAGALGDSVGRYGHGLGIQLTEPPSHTDWDTTVLVPGMVITLEPGMVFAPGRMMVHEENLVIRENGPELLSIRAAPQLPVA
jgi:Xaa-Pro dipeptidase